MTDERERRDGKQLDTIVETSRKYPQPPPKDEPLEPVFNEWGINVVRRPGEPYRYPRPPKKY